jgi:hypothetical protein
MMQWWVGRLGIQIEIRAFCEKIGYMTAGWIGALSMLRCHTISWNVWCIHLNGICWNPYPNTVQIFETCQRKQLLPSRYHKTKCIVHQSNNNMSANGTPPAFQFDTFLTASLEGSFQHCRFQSIHRRSSEYSFCPYCQSCRIQVVEQISNHISQLPWPHTT